MMIRIEHEKDSKNDRKEEKKSGKEREREDIN